METEDLEEFVEAIEGSLMEKGNPPEGVELPMAITNRQAEYLVSKCVSIGDKHVKMFQLVGDRSIRLKGPSIPLLLRGVSGLVSGDEFDHTGFLPITVLSEPSEESEWCVSVR